MISIQDAHTRRDLHLNGERRIVQGIRLHPQNSANSPKFFVLFVNFVVKQLPFLG